MNKKEVVEMLEKGRLIGIMRNAKMHEKELENRPHYDFLDLSLVYAIVIDESTDLITHAAVTFYVMELLGWDEELLFGRIMDSLYRESRVIDFHDIFPISEDDPIHMYALTNKNCMYGATQILNVPALRDLGNRLGANLIIMPSSVDEIIIIPDLGLLYDDDDFNAITNIILEVNSHMMSSNKILGDHPYYYDREKEIVRDMRDL